MAKIGEFDQKLFGQWLATRPDCVKKLATKLPPDRLYKLPNGNRCTIYSYCEDDTVSVTVSGEYNLTIFDRNVFGVKADDLIECDLPSPDDMLGTMLTEEAEIDAFVDDYKKRN